MWNHFLSNKSVLVSNFVLSLKQKVMILGTFEMCTVSVRLKKLMKSPMTSIHKLVLYETIQKVIEANFSPEMGPKSHMLQKSSCGTDEKPHSNSIILGNKTWQSNHTLVWHASRTNYRSTTRLLHIIITVLMLRWHHILWFFRELNQIHEKLVISYHFENNSWLVAVLNIEFDI